jgi:hypothetical protein
MGLDIPMIAAGCAINGTSTGHLSLSRRWYAMTLAMFGMLMLFGAALSRCKFPILFPALGLGILAGVADGIARGDSIGSVLLVIAFIAAALQIGYLLAAVTRAFVAARHRQARETRAIEGVGFR